MADIILTKTYQVQPHTQYFDPHTEFGANFSDIYYFAVALQHSGGKSGYITVLTGGLIFAAPQLVPPMSLNLMYPGQDDSGSGDCSSVDTESDRIPFLHWIAPQAGAFVAPGAFAFVVSCAPVDLKFQVIARPGTPPGSSSSSGY